MDFFEHQARARRKSVLLVLYFLIAVALIVFSVYFAFAATLAGVGGGLADAEHLPVTLWRPELFLGVFAGTLLLVSCGSLYKIRTLSSGGEAVAGMLGGLPVSPHTTDASERKTLNVVEEMAIACGTPVPPVFVLPDENAINAFAAGYTTSDAVIGVTRGCMERLSRDELQGVVAHEFSHILNGDMRVNIRLIGVLHGILLIGILGEILFRTMAYTGGARSRRSGKGGGGASVVLILGLLLVVIGSIGAFFGKLIKSALSRQREFLADASAVQFTRNPTGIGNALKKIGASSSGSRIDNARAEEASHLFFGDAIRRVFLRAFSTHPDLVVRIRRIDPTFDGRFPEMRADTPASGEAQGPVPGRGSRSRGAGEGVTAIEALDRVISMTPVEAVSRIGKPKPEHIAYARSLRESLPSSLMEASRDPYSARALVYGLLLDERPEVRKAQLLRLSQHADPAVFGETTKLLRELGSVLPSQRLPLVDMAFPTLRRLSEDQFRAFCENVHHLMQADHRIDLFEFMLQRILLRHLERKSCRERKISTGRESLRTTRAECEIFLSMLSRFGEKDPEKAAGAFVAGVRKLGGRQESFRPVPPDRCTFRQLNDSLNKLARLSPPEKKLVVEAGVTCVLFDRRVTVKEAELLRAVCDTLDCPMPPLLAAGLEEDARCVLGGSELPCPHPIEGGSSRPYLSASDDGKG